MFHGGNWWSFISFDEEADRPKVSRGLLRRVGSHARPYWGWVGIILVTIVVISLLSLLPPLLIRDLLDHAIPQKDFRRLNLLALGMIGVPLVNGLLGVAQRYASATVGEGIIFDLRRGLYAHMQRMSLRFYTHTQVGELMSRLNNDVVGAQRAVTGTLVTIISDGISLLATAAVMVALDWRLTLVSVVILPLFILPARRVGRTLRRIARQQMDLNARMNALMNETLNISGALLVKIFGRYRSEVERFTERAAGVRDVGVRQAIVGRWFFLALSLVSAIGTAMVFWLGGHFVLREAFTVGTLVAFTGYLTQLYGPLMALTNARVDFATSMVSFERVFEVLDLPVEIQDAPDALAPEPVRGQVRFEGVSFSYLEGEGEPVGLEEVRRFGWGRGAHLCASPEAGGRPGAHAGGEAAAGDSLGAAPGELRDPAGRGGRAGGAQRRREDHHHLSAAALVRPLRGPGAVGWPRSARPEPGVTWPAQVGMVTQETYLFHDTHPQQPALRPPGGHSGRSWRPPAGRPISTISSPGCRTATIRWSASAATGSRGGEKQRVSIARVILKNPQGVDPGRGHQPPGFAVRGPDPAGHGARDARPHLAGDRPPLEHRHGGRQDSGDRRGQAGGAWPAC